MFFFNGVTVKTENKMRDMELRNLTVGSLLFGALKCYVLTSPKILL